VTALAFFPGKILSQKAIDGQKLGQNTGRQIKRVTDPVFQKLKIKQSKKRGKI